MAMKIGRAARTLSAGLGSLLASRGTALPSLGARSFHTDNTKLAVAHLIARNCDVLMAAGAVGLCYGFDVGGKRKEYEIAKAEADEARAEYEALCKSLDEQSLEEQRARNEKMVAVLERERAELDAWEKGMSELFESEAGLTQDG